MVAEPRRQLDGKRHAAALPDPEHGCQLAGHRRPAPDRSEIHEVQAARMRGRRESSQLEAKPCLTAAADPAECEQPRGREQFAGPRKLIPAADEATQWRRQQRGSGGSQGRVTAMNRAAQLREGVRGVDPELVVENPTGGGIYGKCVCTPVTAVKSQHELAGQTLTRRT